jgi:hypothetical protein
MLKAPVVQNELNSHWECSVLVIVAGIDASASRGHWVMFPTGEFHSVIRNK